MDVLIYKQIKKRISPRDYFNLMGDAIPIQHVLRSNIPPDNYRVNYELVNFVLNTIEGLELGLSSEFIIELKKQRPYMNNRDIARFISFNYQDVINKGLIFSESRRGSNYWALRCNAYTRAIRSRSAAIRNIIVDNL